MSERRPETSSWWELPAFIGLLLVPAIWQAKSPEGVTLYIAYVVGIALGLVLGVYRMGQWADDSRWSRRNRTSARGSE